MAVRYQALSIPSTLHVDTLSRNFFTHNTAVWWPQSVDTDQPDMVFMDFAKAFDKVLLGSISSRKQSYIILSLLNLTFM